MLPLSLQSKNASLLKGFAFFLSLILIPLKGGSATLIESTNQTSQQGSSKPASPKMRPPESLLEIVSYTDLFYPHGQFIGEVVIPHESFYFQPGVGLDAKSGMPYDHLRIRLDKGQLGEKGNYTAASKLSLAIPFLLGVMKRKPIFEKVDITPEKAAQLLDRALRTLHRYTIEYSEYSAFFAWSDIRPNGSIAPATTKVPALDNGQLSWALSSVVAALENSKKKNEREMAALAESILKSQDYMKFYDRKKNMMHGTIQFNPVDGTWSGDQSYYLNDMYEGTLAVLWAVLHKHIPEEAWHNLAIPSTEYVTREGEVITTLQGFRASFHEHWGLIYLPLLRSPLAPLYQNYLYAQADYAHRHGLPGFISTAYDARGTYRQMGVPLIASQPVDRSDVSAVFATALGVLISPQIGIHWFKNIYTFRGVQTPEGAVESVGPDGYADIFTADGKGLTLMALSGGVLQEVEQYLKTRKYPETDMTLYDKLMELYNAKYEQLMKNRNQEPIYMPTRPYPKPAAKQIEVKAFNVEHAGDVFSITQHLQGGHLHGKNTRSMDAFSLEDDIRPGQDIIFDFDVPAYFPYFDQWAFRGTYIDKAVGVAGLKFMSVSIPTDAPPMKFDLEVKSDDITLAYATIDTAKPAHFSEDGKWKTYVESIHVIPEADYKPFNYFSVTMHDPSYLLGEHAKYGRQGEVRLRNITLSKAHPFEKKSATVTPEGSQEKKHTVGDVELLQFWRTNHGAIAAEKNDENLIYKIPGGRGWKGGYLPYIVIENYRYMHVRVRNQSGSCNCFNIEIKNEDNQLFSRKIPIKIPSNDHWYTYEIRMPQDMTVPINYLALSDPLGDFDLSSLSFSEISSDSEGVVPVDPDTRLKCTNACQKTAL